MTRKELAHKYGTTPRTLHRWLKRLRLHVGRGYLTPAEIKRITDALGPFPEK